MNRAVLFFLVLLAGCSDAPDKTGTSATIDSTQQELPAAAFAFDSSFPSLSNYFVSQDSSFDPLRWQPGDITIKNEEGLALDSNEFRQYRSYFLWNADSSYALDLVSYNFLPVTKKGRTTMEEQGPDFETAIIDVNNRKRTRLLFFGSSGGSVLDARWLDNSNLVIAGAVDWESSDSLRPAAWKYNVLEKTWQPFYYERRISADWSKYPKKLFKLNR